ncbi:hypothetical protein CC2G_004420 [Coprinopsis cinerea AmutBmut pab1-1]|nr:hypothetical protein CC2G_004420 [Coprinopsis cinerea AmutBmut pab1-1]
MPEVQEPSVALDEPSPIHTFVPDKLDLSYKGCPDGSTVRVGDIIYWLRNLIVSDFPRVNAAHTAPFHGRPPYPSISMRFPSPKIHLTREFLDTTITIGEGLWLACGALAEELRTEPLHHHRNPYSEYLTTRYRLIPLVSALLALCRELSAKDRFKWRCRRWSLELPAGPNRPQVELDIPLEVVHYPLVTGLPEEFMWVVSAIDSLSPKTCNNTNVLSFLHDDPNCM